MHVIYEVSVKRNEGQFLMCNIKGASSITNDNENGISMSGEKNHLPSFIRNSSSPIE
jgi:hypothetical protein